MLVRVALAGRAEPRHEFLIMKLSVISLLFLTSIYHGTAGERISLTDLSAFKPTTSNWKVVGDVTVDHRQEKAIGYRKGQGILYCNPTEESKNHIFTKLEHADIELEVEVLVPLKSNSGLYFMGRYEVQILDSWGVTNPKHADIGGIYQRWDESRGKGREGYEGHAPPVNAARKPGEWQQFRISFRAPRFNAAGKKIRNARFEEVWLNGTLLHENVELNGPTRSPGFEQEADTGPLMIQGDHGPVALRNLKIKVLEP